MAMKYRGRRMRRKNQQTNIQTKTTAQEFNLDSLPTFTHKI
jgi:hypothetical protein